MTNTPIPLKPQAIPTLYFIGVTTSQSSMAQLFPQWNDILGIEAAMVGYDAPLQAPPDIYRAIVRHIKEDPLSMGALITSHKIDLLNAARDLFDQLDPLAELCQEVSAITKQDNKLVGLAMDPVLSGIAWRDFIPPGHWRQTGGHILCLGAGGAGTAISVFAAELHDPEDRPAVFTIVERDALRLAKLKTVHAKLNTTITFRYMLNENPNDNDKQVANLPPGSMVINATGMGKDRPGSPLTEAAIFPQNGLVWELNYRGPRAFLQQAQAQATARNLIVEDGWVYFLHGWSQIIAKVFHLMLAPDTFDRLSQAASSLRQ